MKHFLILLSALLYLNQNTCHAQNVDYNTVILPPDIEDVDITEKLVRLAWQNYPINEVAQHQVMMAKHNIGLAGSRWLDLVTIQGNLNEFNINPSANPNTNNFYPRYNIGISIPLGVFMSAPKDIKIAKEKYAMSKLDLNQQKLTLRAEVLTRYQNYLSAKELLKINSEAENDAYNSYVLIEEQFKSGAISVSQFMGTSRLYSDQKAIKTRSQNAYMISIITLEEIIGIKLQDVL